MSDNLIECTASAYNYPLLIKNLLYSPVVDNPEQEIVYCDQLRFSYSEFRQRVSRLANSLIKLGVQPGDTVAVMDWDSHRYLECFFAIPMIGAVLHTVNVRLPLDQIVYTIDHAEDDFIFVNSEFLPIVEQIKDRISTVRSFILLTDEQDLPETSLPLAGEYESLLAAAETEFNFPDLDENTRATTFYTTGTTGMPKGVYFSHRQLVLHTLAALAALGTPTVQGRFHQQDVYMPITPMFHVHAWGVPYIATTLGVKQVYPGRYIPDMLLQLIETEGVTFSHCVPTIMHMLMDSPKFSTVDLSRWKVIIGGAALPKKMCQAALARGIDIFTGYGMSETCPILTLAHTNDEDLNEEAEIERRCKTGRPIPLVELKVVDGEMQEVEPGSEQVGEIVVRTPWLTQGYLKDKENSENLWLNGYLHTGDVAAMDQHNYVNITDRMKDVIKMGGEWLSSLELEDVINLHPAVAEVAVIGMADQKWGERPLALIVLKEDQKQLAEEEMASHIKGFIDKGVLVRFASQLNIRMVDAIEKTSVGKINKKLLREKHL
jgi:fatty-acyl-CoA synthase